MTGGPTPSRGTRPPHPRSRRQLWTITFVGLVVLGLGVWLVSARLTRLLSTTAQPAGTPADSTAAAASVRKIQATLFYLSDDATALVPVGRDVVYGDTPSEQVRRIVEAQVAAPPDGKRSAIPNGTTVRAVFLTPRGEAYVDLGGTIRTGHTGGSLDEALTVYAIVNAVAVNLPDISSVQLLVEGKQVDTLVGHLDLRHPLGKALEWVRKGP
jgi:hypothetical protein